MNGEEDQIREVFVGPEVAGLRLDRFLVAAMPDLSRNRLQALISEGFVEAIAPNGRGRIVTPAMKMRAGERIRMKIPAATPALPEAQSIPLDVVYEDDDLIVIDKPAGLVVHPAAGHEDSTLVNALLAHCGSSLSGIGGVRRPGIVHRIDKDTSGLLVVAKNDRVHTGLAKQFADHSIERAYQAVVWGLPSPSRGQVDAAIGRDPHDRKRMSVREASGRDAVTNYRTVEAFGTGAALIECRLETGRTHQIRVHMDHIGHPLIGDPVYGRASRARLAGVRHAIDAIRAFRRQALHAAVLGFEHPVQGVSLRFERPPPDDFSELVGRLRLLD